MSSAEGQMNIRDGAKINKSSIVESKEAEQDLPLSEPVDC